MRQPMESRIWSCAMLCGFVFALAIAALAGGSLAQTPSKPTPTPDATKKPPGNCSVSGRVLSADGTPLRSARVGLIQANERKHPLVYATTTDNEGSFDLKQIEAGRYEFFASHIGYLDQHYQAKGTEEGEGAMLSLASGQEISDVVFRLVHAAVITGKVVDEGGEPMTNVTVSVLHKPSAEDLEDAGPRVRKQEMISASVGVTDDRGQYRIFGLKPGEYCVKAAETANPPIAGPIEIGSDWRLLHELGSQYAPLFYPGVLQVNQAQAVTLRAGEEMEADFALRRAKLVEVAGRVIGPDGFPAVGAYVRLSQAGVSDWGGELGTGTDVKGEFSIKGVSPGSYDLSVSQSDRGRHYHTQQKLEVGEEKIGSVVLAIGRGAKLRGRITAYGGTTTAYGRIQVHLQSVSEDGTSGFSMAEVNKDGTFDLEGVADGSYMLRIGGLEQGWYVKAAHFGNEDVLQKGVQLENGGVAGILDVVISSDGAQLEGTVTESDQNQALAGVQLRARPEPETDFNRFRSHEASTDQNGH